MKKYIVYRDTEEVDLPRFDADKREIFDMAQAKLWTHGEESEILGEFCTEEEARKCFDDNKHLAGNGNPVYGAKPFLPVTVVYFCEYETDEDGNIEYGGDIIDFSAEAFRV